MKTINQDELFQNLSEFLKSRGIELKDGSYSQRIRQGCNLLADAVNATQKTVKRAKVEVGKTLGHFRQTIHEATGPKPPAAPTGSPPPPPPPFTPPPADSAKPRQSRSKKSAPRAKARPRK